MTTTGIDALTAAQVAARLGVSLRSLHRIIDAGHLTPAFQLPGRTGALLFDRAAVEALAAERAS